MKILSLQLAVRRKAYSKRDKSLFLHYGFNYSALTDTGANWAALTTGLWAAPKLKVAYYQLVNATKINNFSTRQLSSHAATPCTWQSCRHYQRRQKKKHHQKACFSPVRLVLGVREGGGWWEWISNEFNQSPCWELMFTQHNWFNINCFIMLCLDLWHVFVISLFAQSYKKF